MVRYTHGFRRKNSDPEGLRCHPVTIYFRASELEIIKQYDVEKMELIPDLVRGMVLAYAEEELDRRNSLFPPEFQDEISKDVHLHSE